MTAIPTALHAAFRLARGDAGGLTPLGDAPEGPAAGSVRDSFRAMAVALPPFLLLHVLESDSPDRPDLAHDLLGYVIGWVGFVLLSHFIAVRSGRGALWPRYVAAWNWCSVVQYIVVAAAGLIAAAGVVPDVVAETIWLVSVGWALWLEYFLARAALGFGVLASTGMVALSYLVATLMASLGLG